MALPSRARSTRLLVVTLVSVSLLTITVDYREGDRGPLAGLGRSALALISPLQEVVSKVTHPVGNFFSTLVSLPSIRAENQRLRTRVAELEAQSATYVSQERRLNELESILNVQQSLGPKVKTLAAEVIANGISNFEWTITIGAGSSSGIAVDMPVVVGSSSGGAMLVGHVVRVAPDSSMVQLVIDPESSVAGRIEPSGDTGLVAGEGAQDMRMGLVDTTASVTAGTDTVVTAGYRIPGVAQGMYPPGILIGTVSRVVQNDAALEKFVTVSPAVDFSSLGIVLVVLSNGSG